jgi:hypothetical protein
MSSTYYPAYNAITFSCDYRTRVGCAVRAERDAYTGLPVGWVNCEGGHLCHEHANVELQNATIEKPHISAIIFNNVFEDGVSTVSSPERPPWEPATQAMLF